MLSAQEVTGIGSDGAYRAITLADGTALTANAVLLAPGSTYRRLGVPGEEDYLGAGIHFCATCDGPFYRGQEVLVIGGGNSAGEESLFLTRFASHVTILVRGEGLSASAVVREKVAECDTITVRPHTVVEGFEGAHSQLTAVRVRDTASGATETLHPAGVFVFIGLQPNTAFLVGSSRSTSMASSSPTRDCRRACPASSRRAMRAWAARSRSHRRRARARRRRWRSAPTCSSSASRVARWARRAIW